MINVLLFIFYILTTILDIETILWYIFCLFIVTCIKWNKAPSHNEMIILWVIMYIGGNPYKLNLPSCSSFFFKIKKKKRIIKLWNCTLCRILWNVLLCTTRCAYLIEIIMYNIIVVILLVFFVFFFEKRKIKIWFDLIRTWQHPFQTLNRMSRFYTPFSHWSIYLFSCIWNLPTMLQISSCHTYSQKDVSWSQLFEQLSACL